MYCHNSLGIVVVPPPPPEGSTTSSTNRVVVWCPRRSVAFRRMTDPDQDSGGYGRFVQTLPPIVKIPSSATLSGNTPSSRIWIGASQGVPEPYQPVMIANTESGFRSLSGSATLAYR